MAKKNIWVINQHSYPPGTSNWTRHYDIFKNFFREYNIDVVGGSYVHDRRKQILDKHEKHRKVIFQNISYHILKGISYRNSVVRVFAMIEFFLRVVFYHNRIENKPDIIYSSSPHPFSCLAGVYLSKKYKCKHIVEIRDIWPETWIEIGKMTERNVVYKLFLCIEKFIYKSSDKIISLTSNKNHFLNYGISSDKVELISNGVDISQFDYYCERNQKKNSVGK